MPADLVRRRRAAAQLLDPAGAAVVGADPVRAVTRLLAVQAQDTRSVRLALRARSAGLRAAHVDAALADRRLVAGWLLRGTLHLVAAEDYAWLWSLTAPRQARANQRRLGELGVSAADQQRALALLSGALGDGPLGRGEVAALLDRHGVPRQGQALPHLMLLAALRGVCVLGAPVGGSPSLVATEHQLDRALDPDRPVEGEERQELLARLAGRYVGGHGPSGPEDLAAWSGLPLGDARRGWEAMDASDRRRADPAGAPGPSDPSTPLPPRLLPTFDDYLLGWKDRSFAVPTAHARAVAPGGGMVRACLVVDGRAAGTWTAPRRGGRPVVVLELLAGSDSGDPDALATEVADVERFLADA